MDWQDFLSHMKSLNSNYQSNKFMDGPKELGSTSFNDMGNYGTSSGPTGLATAGYTEVSPYASSDGKLSSDNLWGALGTTDAAGNKTQGWGSPAINLAQGVGSAFMGMKQYGLAKDQLQFSKDAFNKNYDAQRMSTNTNLEDRQYARVAANPGAYQSVSDYMSQHRVA